MYTKIKNVQIIVSLLKQHGIRHIVLSAGTRHVPIAHSVENDSFFQCYSVVDERSAGYFALGLSKELQEPVAIACTSSTATANYMPPIAEAYYQKIPLLILTGDRDPYLLDQLEDQMINQVDMYKNFCRKCVNLPIVQNEHDEWYCQRLVNDAILELKHKGSGPVQINFPINQSIMDIADASVPELPNYNKITRLELSSSETLWLDKVNELKKYKRILIVCGSKGKVSNETEAVMEAFAKKFNCVFTTEPLSNLHFPGTLNTYLLSLAITGKVLKQFEPDLVIFFGGNFISRFKVMLKGLNEIRSWLISDEGDVCDPFQNLSTIFECPVEKFFNFFATHAGNIQNNKALYNDLKQMMDKLPIPEIIDLPKISNEYSIRDARFKNLPTPSTDELVEENYLSSTLVFSELSKRLPKGSLLHLSILNSVRMMSAFPIDDSITVYCNIGTDGIDGSLSTFFGQAAATDRPCYLVVGDLSFFYDMNAIGIRGLSPNIHVLLINNGGGAEFYFSMGPKMLPNIDMHISASHNKRAKDWVISNHFQYLEASSIAELDDQINDFVNPKQNAPILFEIFTDKEKDIKVFKAFTRAIHQDTAINKIAETIDDLPIIQKITQTSTGRKIKDTVKKGIDKFL